MKTHAHALVSAAGPQGAPRCVGRLAALLLLSGALLLGGCLVHTPDQGLPPCPAALSEMQESQLRAQMRSGLSIPETHIRPEKAQCQYRGKRWVRGHYVMANGSRIRWVPPHWRATRITVVPPSLKIVTRPLPAKRPVVIPARPGAGYIWVKGFYTFRDGRYRSRVRSRPTVVQAAEITGLYIALKDFNELNNRRSGSPQGST